MSLTDAKLKQLLDVVAASAPRLRAARVTQVKIGSIEFSLSPISEADLPASSAPAPAPIDEEEDDDNKDVLKSSWTRGIPPHRGKKPSMPGVTGDNTTKKR